MCTFCSDVCIGLPARAYSMCPTFAESRSRNKEPKEPVVIGVALLLSQSPQFALFFLSRCEFVFIRSTICLSMFAVFAISSRN